MTDPEKKGRKNEDLSSREMTVIGKIYDHLKEEWERKVGKFHAQSYFRIPFLIRIAVSCLKIIAQVPHYHVTMFVNKIRGSFYIIP